MAHRPLASCADQQGMVLLLVLVILLAVGGSSASFVWLMNQQQTKAGVRYRAAAATLAAEAGVHRALAVLEGSSPDVSTAGRWWRPSEYTETIPTGAGEGRITVAISEEPGGALMITSTGEVGGTSRRLRARVYLAPPALLTALYAPGIVQIQSPPTSSFFLPYGAGLNDRPWVHIAAGREVWFTRSDVMVNDPSTSPDVALGPAMLPGSQTRGASVHPGPLRVLLARDGELTVGRTRTRVDVEQLRSVGLFVDGTVARTAQLPPLPEVDRAYFRALAALNTANASINASAGKNMGNAVLAQKQDSLYSSLEFEQIQAYVASLSASPKLRGTIYLQDALVLGHQQQLQIEDGAMIVEGAVYLSPGSVLEITHSTLTRTLPGLIALDNNTIVVTERARLFVHGLVYATKTMAIDDGARVDVVGAVLTGDPDLSFRNASGTFVIRYDPAVLGTPGLKLPADAQVIAWVAAWQELP